MNALLPVLSRSIAALVGARIRELRVDAELTQAALAGRLGSHRPVIGRIERGLHVLDLQTCGRIAAALGLDLGTLLICLDVDWIAAGQQARSWREAA